MHYCRGLSFTQDPDYSYIIGLFESCMKRNGINVSTPDFVWNKNRLVLEKEYMKQQMIQVLKKKGGAGKKKEDDK